MQFKKHNDEWQLSLALRFLSVDMIEKAKSGHPGMPLGMADVATVLFKYFVKFNPNDPEWLDRDRVIFSAGHGSALLYSILYLTGYKGMDLEQIKNFRQLGYRTPGHPEYGVTQGVEATTGPLGQGLANAVGIALVERIRKARTYKYDTDNVKSNDKSIGHKTYVICGDGCLMEGISHEAASLAGHLQLKNLIVLFDDNNISIDGDTALSTSDNHILRFKSYGWSVYKIDGQDYEEIIKTLQEAQHSKRPVFIACKTKIAYGAPEKVGSHHAHGAPLGTQEVAKMRELHNWHYEPFVIPEKILNAWRKMWERNASEYDYWKKHLESHNKELQNYCNDNSAEKIQEAIIRIKQDVIKSHIAEATRVSSGRVLKYMSKVLPNLIGGSADLSSSNNTKTESNKAICKQDYSGNYIHYGIREHAMFAVMNGMAVYGNGIIPYAGTFLVFSDYARPSIRLAAIMKKQIICIMTHDSIGVGEDGPTHQPVEHLASLRAIPNLHIFRPADAIETAECWELALLNRNTPSIMALSRQVLSPVRTIENIYENKSSKGAYVVKESSNELKVTIFATGSEVEIALGAAEILEKSKIGTQIISVPCMELFYQQDKRYQQSLLDDKSLKVVIEAGVRQGWDAILGKDGIFIGINTFGKSGPYTKVYEHFNITPQKIEEKIRKKIQEANNDQ